MYVDPAMTVSANILKWFDKCVRKRDMKKVAHERWCLRNLVMDFFDIYDVDVSTSPGKE